MSLQMGDARWELYRGSEFRTHLEALELANLVKEECLGGVRVMCCNRIALSDGGFTLNIENA